MKKETFKNFKKNALHTKDDLFAICCINPISVRVAYIIKKYNLKISANQVTYARLFVFSPLILLCLLLAPLFALKGFYWAAIILSYLFLFSDWLDGQIARGTKTFSDKGAFLDSIADRFSTIIFMVLLFSLGLWFQDYILLLSSIIIFSLKTFHMMVITKVFYYDKHPDNAKLFSGERAYNQIGLGLVFSLFHKINSVLKIKHWGESLGGSERYLATIVVPLLLLVLGFEFYSWVFSCFLAFMFIIFFLIRIKSLLQSQLKGGDF